MPIEYSTDLYSALSDCWFESHSHYAGGRHGRINRFCNGTFYEALFRAYAISQCHSAVRPSAIERLNVSGACVPWGPRTVIPVSPFVSEKYLKSTPEKTSPSVVENKVSTPVTAPDPAALVLGRASPVFKSVASSVVLTSLSSVPGAEYVFAIKH